MTRCRRCRLAGLEFCLTDVVTLGGLVAFTLAIAVFARRMAHPGPDLGIGLVTIVLYVLSLAGLTRIRRPWARFVVRTVAVQVTFLQVYKLANELQIVFFPWQDERVLAWEQALFGVQPLVAVQRIYNIPLNEWMFFVYVFYILIYPMLAAIIFFRHGEDANEDFLLQLGLANLICGVGFIVFPVASPMYWPRIRSLLTRPLPAHVFGAIAEWIRGNIHQPGGSIPSPHCAAATVMWFMARKYTRYGFWALAPVMISLFASTVYGRFHYVSDMVLGIAAGLLVLAAAPALERAWNGPAVPEPEGLR